MVYTYGFNGRDSYSFSICGSCYNSKTCEYRFRVEIKKNPHTTRCAEKKIYISFILLSVSEIPPY